MTLDLEDRLRRDLPRLADVIDDRSTGGDRAGEASVLALGDRPSTRRPRWLAAAAAVLLVGGAMGAAVVLGDDDGRSDTGVAAEQTGPLATWRALSAGPLRAREDAASLWTGSEWLVLGGRQGTLALADGAAYDPAAGTWRELAADPTPHPGSHAVWTGREAVVLAKYGGSRYDPRVDAWTDVAGQDPDAAGGAVPAEAVAWTGSRVAVAGFEISGADGDAAIDLVARTYDPAADTWGPVALAPDVQASTVAVDDQTWDVAIAGTHWDGRRLEIWLNTGEGYAYDVGNTRLTPLPRLPFTPTPSSLVVAGTGERTYALGYTDGFGGRFAQLTEFVDGAWTTDPPDLDLGRSPGDDGVDDLVVAGDELVAFFRERAPAVIDPTTGGVRSLAGTGPNPGSGRAVAWTGTELLVLGGRDTPVETGPLTTEARALAPTD